MPLQMNNALSRPLASQVGASGTLFRPQNDAPLCSGNNISNITNVSGSGKEGIVQKLQGVLFAVRRDRDREHRSRDIAMEKLRSAKGAFKAEQSNFKEENEKLAKTRDEAETTQKEILRKEATIQHLQQKYQFQHEDLIRKREKIQQQNSALQATTLQRNKSVLDARRRLDRQRDKYLKLERMEDEESANFLATIISLAREENKSSSAHNVNVITGTKRGSEEKALDQKEFRPIANSLDKFQEALEKKHEQALIREFKTNIDHGMLPKMISQKAQTLKIETETVRAEITRLEATLHETAKANYQQEQERRFDAGMDVPFNGAFAETVGNRVEEKNAEGSLATFENTMTGKRYSLQEGCGGSDVEMKSNEHGQ